jgi:hypothetical protein
LEEAIAFHEVTNCRPQVYIQTGNLHFNQKKKNRSGITAQALNTWDDVAEYFQQTINPEAFGFENMDALTYYTDKLVELNNKVSVL